MKLAALLLLLIPLGAKGEGAANVYELSALHPISVSAYPTEVPSIRRFYLHFKNADGNHFVVYEEDSVRPPLDAIHDLKNSIQGWKASCSMELRCNGKALCTGKCANMYYQVSNMGEAGGAASKCQLVSFSCFQSGEKKAEVAAAPAPAPAPIPLAPPSSAPAPAPASK